MTLTDKELTELFDLLDTDCWSCSGGNRVPPTIEAEDSSCDICHGKHKQLTDAGRTLLDFLKRHGITEVQPQ